jgi:hypothetical protein
MSTDFAALRSVAIGTKRTYRDDLLFVRFRAKADMRRRVFVSVAMGQVENAKRMRFTIRTPIEFR